MEAIGKNVNDEARLFVNTDVASSVINPKIASTASSEYWNRGGDLNHAASKDISGRARPQWLGFCLNFYLKMRS